MRIGLSSKEVKILKEVHGAVKARRLEKEEEE